MSQSTAKLLLKRGSNEILMEIVCKPDCMLWRKHKKTRSIGGQVGDNCFPDAETDRARGTHSSYYLEHEPTDSLGLHFRWHCSPPLAPLFLSLVQLNVHKRRTSFQECFRATFGMRSGITNEATSFAINNAEVCVTCLDFRQCLFTREDHGS